MSEQPRWNYYFVLLFAMVAFCCQIFKLRERKSASSGQKSDLFFCVFGTSHTTDAVQAKNLKSV